MFTRRYIKHGKLLIRHAEKLLRYRRDVLSETTIADLKTQIERVRRPCLRDRDGPRPVDGCLFGEGGGKEVRAAKPGGWRVNLSAEERKAMLEIMGEKLAELRYIRGAIVPA